VTDDTEGPEVDPTDDTDDELPLAPVLPFSRTMTAKARHAVRHLWDHLDV